MSARFVCPPQHKHGGSSTCYKIHGCRCRPCAFTVSEQGRRRARVGWDPGLVDAGPAREHIAYLRAAGLGRRRIAEVAGVSDTGLSQIIYGRTAEPGRPAAPVRRIKRETAERILAVQPRLEYIGASVKIPSRPYARRLQALVAAGWSQARLCARLGITRQNFLILRDYERALARRRPTSARIRADTARAIVALYDDLAYVKPPTSTPGERVAASRAVNYARARRWAVPMDWAAIDDDFDRPTPARRSIP